MEKGWFSATCITLAILTGCIAAPAPPASAVGQSMRPCMNGWDRGSVTGSTSPSNGYTEASTYHACGSVGISVVYGSKSRFKTSWSWAASIAVVKKSRISVGYHKAERSSEFRT